MATASWAKETDGKINYTKLCRLLVDGGTQAVRSVFDGIYPPSSLKAILNANKTTLQKLKKPKGKVLNNEPWEKLYPPSGSDPTSEDFDITLLYVLLRNICGLTRPATGWDALPPVTDASKEANLARIKYYRNNAIAHKSSTEISDADFKQHWQDVSSALLSLGLSQDDIDDLKSDPLGKNDYNQLLDDWYVSDQDIKIQLEDLKLDTADIKSDTADLKSDTADLKSDTADLKSDTADLKSDTAGLESDTADLKSDTADLKSDTADLKSDTADIKSDTADLKSDTAYLKSDTAGIKSDTAGIKSDTAGLKSDTADLKSDTTDIKSDTADIKSDTADIKSDTADIKIKLDDIARGMKHFEPHKMSPQIQNLAFSDFRSEIDTKCRSFDPNTRQWILDQVRSHVEAKKKDSSVMLITAGPGMGKSTLAAKICQIYKDLGSLAGCHFFQSSNSTRNNPRLMLQSVARQMYDTVPGYGAALERKLQTNLGKTVSEMKCEELLTILIEEPLCNVEQPNSNLAVVIDALDECSNDARDELLKALKKKLPCFPSWLRFIITSRPSTNTSALGSTVAVEIKPEDQSNLKDLEIYFICELKTLYPQTHQDEITDLVQNLVQLTKGLFLFGYFVIEYLKKENGASSEKVLKLFPNGISSVYENYFSRLKEVLLPYISEEERFYKMLGAIAATNNPLPKTMFYNILGLKSNHEVPRQERKTRKDALDALHWLFPVEEDSVTPFHKSVVDWLTLQEDQEHDFSVRVEDGDEVLASQCNDVLSEIRNGEKDLDKPLNLTDSEMYALGFFDHLVKKRSEVVKANTFGFFSNVFLLTASHIKNINFLTNYMTICKVYHITDILSCLASFIRTIRRHDPSCYLFCNPPFGCYLALVLQFAHLEGAGSHLTLNPVEALKKHNFPYFDLELITESLVMIHERARTSVGDKQHLFICKDGFIAVVPSFNARHIYLFQLDGCFIKHKEIVSMGMLCIAASPNVNFIVAASRYDDIITILDTTTLEVVSQYKPPTSAIETCHVFRDDRGCFIVVKGFGDNKVYVIEGLTGQVHNTITVPKASSVMVVSCQGHIVMTRWRREIFLYHNASDREVDPIIIHPLEEKTCFCSYSLSESDEVEAIHVSEDGCLLAYHYGGSIFIVKTSDGSLFKRWPIGVSSRSWLDILFVSESYLVIIEGRFLFVINIQTDEVEHRIYVPHAVSSRTKQYLLFPKAEGKSFDLIYTLLPRDCEVSRLVFHNLNLQGLQ